MKPQIFLLILVSQFTFAQTVNVSLKDSLCSYKKTLTPDGKLLSWYKPEVPGAAYSQVMKLASEYIKKSTPIDPSTGLKLYYISCCFHGPHMRSEADYKAGKTWEDWMNNPACVFAGLVQSLVLDYRVYSGDSSYVSIVKEMLDYQLENGTTPANFVWGNVPYASADPGSKKYFGATKWEKEAMRGDGKNGVEPDKIGELGYAYLKFYEVTEQKKYLTAAINCADALAKNAKKVTSETSNFSTFKIESPWPFRVNAETGVVIDKYTSHIIDIIRLFDELLRVKDVIKLDPTKAEAYKKTRDMAWSWLYDKNGPMKTFVWNGYFEDIPNDTFLTNRNQVSPMETARYLIKNPSLDKNIDVSVPSLMYFVKNVFGLEGEPAIKEQTWCFEPMGSHTARYASICALWYERTGDSKYKDEAFYHFNFATYATDQNGIVRVGPTWPGTWFSDGYSDYIKHFMDGLAAIPEWAPENENHLLRSTSAVQKIKYADKKIYIKTFDNSGKMVFRLKEKPKSILNNGKPSTEMDWKALNTGGVLKIDQKGSVIELIF